MMWRRHGGMSALDCTMPGSPTMACIPAPARGWSAPRSPAPSLGAPFSRVLSLLLFDKAILASAILAAGGSGCEQECEKGWE